VLQFQASRILKYVHMNFERYYSEFLSNHWYFLIIVDDFICYIWIWLFKFKNMHAVSTAVKEFKVYIKIQFQCKVMQTWTDNITDEFKNQEWCKIVVETDIQHESSSLYTHDLNEIAEQTIQIIKKMTISLLIQIRFSICFWTEAFATIVYLWNQLSIRIFLIEMISLVTVYSESKFN